MHSQLFTPEEIEEFRWLVKEHRRVELTPTEAAALAEQLLRVLHIIRDVTKTNTLTPRVEFGV